MDESIRFVVYLRGESNQNPGFLNGGAKFRNHPQQIEWGAFSEGFTPRN